MLRVKLTSVILAGTVLNAGAAFSAEPLVLNDVQMGWVTAGASEAIKCSGAACSMARAWHVTKKADHDPQNRSVSVTRAQVDVDPPYEQGDEVWVTKFNGNRGIGTVLWSGLKKTRIELRSGQVVTFLNSRVHAH
jgi:hypothetical protein